MINLSNGMTIRPFLLMLLLVVAGSQEVSYVCSPDQMPSGSPFFSLVGKLLVLLEQDNAVNGYNFETTVYDSTTATAAYGQSVCYQLLSPLECTTCLTFLGEHVWQICSNSLAASVGYGVNCSITYTTYIY